MKSRKQNNYIDGLERAKEICRQLSQYYRDGAVCGQEPNRETIKGKHLMTILFSFEKAITQEIERVKGGGEC